LVSAASISGGAACSLGDADVACTKHGANVLALEHLAVAKDEHRAVLDALESHGDHVAPFWIAVDEKARLSLDDIRAVLEKGCDLLCVMAANNEVGTIYPIEQIARLAQSYGVPLMTVHNVRASGTITRVIRP
jgi:cysteine desulfurase